MMGYIWRILVYRRRAQFANGFESGLLLVGKPFLHDNTCRSLKKRYLTSLSIGT